MSWTMEWKQTQNYKGVAYFLEDEQQRFSMVIDRNSQFETAEGLVNVLNAAVAAEREGCAAKCDAIAQREAAYTPPGDIPKAFVQARVKTAEECATAIRASRAGRGDGRNYTV